MGELYGGREAEIGRFLNGKRVQESRDRESAEEIGRASCRERV